MKKQSQLPQSVIQKSVLARNLVSSVKQLLVDRSKACKTERQNL